MKPLLIKTTLVWLGICCGLLLLEGGLRLFFPFEVSFDNPKVFWDHWAKSSPEETKKHASTFNAIATYDEELGYILMSVAAQEAGFNARSGMRIMLLGDSIMYSEEFSQPIIRAFKKNYPEVRVDFFNASAPGWDTAQEANYLQHRGYKYKPNLVILQFCLNDFSATPVFWETKPGEFLALNSGKWGKYINNSFLSSSELFQRLLISYLRSSPFEYELDLDKVRVSFEKIAALSRHHDFQVNLVLIPYLRTPTDMDIMRAGKVRELASKIFRQDQISDFLDLQFTPDLSKWKKEEADYTHPNSDFAKVVAEEILKKP